MSTLASGQSITQYLSGGQYLTLSASSSSEGTLTVVEASGNGSLFNTQTKHRYGPIALSSAQYGPYGLPVNVTIASIVGAVTYTLNGEGIAMDGGGNAVGVIGTNGVTVGLGGGGGASLALVSPAANNTYSGFTTLSFNAGAAIAQWSLVYMGSGGTWLLADATGAATSKGSLSLATVAGTNGISLNVGLPGGFARNDSWAWTVGAPLYASTTPGAMTETPPVATNSVTRVIAFAVSATVVYFLPESSYLTHI